LPWQIAHALEVVNYPITHPDAHGKRGEQDETLIPWMCQQPFVWITKDDAAKKAHRNLMIQHGLSVLWVRGLERSKASISTHDLHLMLATKLMPMAQSVAGTRGGVFHAMVHAKSGSGYVLERVDLHKIEQDKKLPTLGRVP